MNADRVSAVTQERRAELASLHARMDGLDRNEPVRHSLSCQTRQLTDEVEALERQQLRRARKAKAGASG
jgi:hypothetical protein